MYPAKATRIMPRDDFTSDPLLSDTYYEEVPPYKPIILIIFRHIKQAHSRHKRNKKHLRQGKDIAPSAIHQLDRQILSTKFNFIILQEFWYLICKSWQRVEHVLRLVFSPIGALLNRYFFIPFPLCHCHTVSAQARSNMAHCILLLHKAANNCIV